MADNVEKFILKFVSDDKEVVRKIKSLSSLLDGLNKKHQQSIKFGRMKEAQAQKAVSAVNREISAQQKLNRQKQKSVRLSKEAANTRTQRVTSTKMFEQARMQNPGRAQDIERALGVNFQRNTERSKQSIIALRAEIRRLSDQYRRTARSAGFLRTSQTGLQDSTRNLIRTYASLFAVLGATHQINKAGQSFEAMESAMLAAMGSKEDAAKQIQFLDKTTSKLGLSLLDTADQYTKFTFAAKGKMPTEEINEFFKSMAEAGTVLGVSKERMKLSFNAVQQMLNKTNVQSEELKRQLDK